MRRRQGLVYGAVGTTAAAMLLSAGAPAHAADAKAQCIAAYEQGQKLKQESKLFEARKQLLLCTREVCAEMLRTDCEQWLKEVDQTMPSVVIAAKDAKGADITAVRVTIDGNEAAERLDGKAIQLDPGDHVFRFEHEGEKAVERKVLIREGEKHRVIHVTFGSSQQATETPSDNGRPIPVLTWVFGGLGLVGLGSFAYFGLTGKSEADDYQACKPYCNQSDVDSTRTKLIVADVSLAVGVVSLGVATYLLIARPGSSSSDKDAALRFHIAPTTGGAFGGISRSF